VCHAFQYRPAETSTPPQFLFLDKDCREATSPYVQPECPPPPYHDDPPPPGPSFFPALFFSFFVSQRPLAWRSPASNLRRNVTSNTPFFSFPPNPSSPPNPGSATQRPPQLHCVSFSYCPSVHFFFCFSCFFFLATNSFRAPDGCVPSSGGTVTDQFHFTLAGLPAEDIDRLSCACGIEPRSAGRLDNPLRFYSPCLTPREIGSLYLESAPAERSVTER